MPIHSKHGESRVAGTHKNSTEYKAWKAMRERCNNPRCRHFANYGGRGIKVCARWSDFALFLADMGRKPTPKHSIDRVDNDKGYEPENCRWATPSEQACNRQNTVRLTLEGRTASLKEWCEKKGIAYATVWSRIATGMSPEAALSTPAREYQHTEITIAGRTAALAAWCQENGIPVKIARSRIKDGMTPEAAVTTPVSPKSRGYQITIDGETASLKEWCARNGVSASTAYARIAQGMAPVDAVSLPMRSLVRYEPITIDGKAATLEEWCQRNGIKPETALERIKRGWTREAAVSVPTFSAD